MSDTGELLENAEVEFLIGAENTEPASDTEAPEVSSREVTMRGELDQINLSDIFQTLAMSKMEGLLCVSNPVEQREVYFKDGYVRCISPFRLETLRLGQRLIRARLLTSDQLRSALLEQKQNGEPLGQILVQSGAVDQSDLDDILLNQLQEDLYALFTWTRGSFEFYRGEVTNPGTRQRLDSAPEFDANGVLLEVARRSDEWLRIFDILRSLDEIFESPWEEQPPDLTDDQRLVLDAIDGRVNVRDLADATLLGLFDCARTVRELVEKGTVSPVSVDKGLDAAESQANEGQLKLASLTVHAMLERTAEIDNAQRVRAADLLERCSETKLASQIFLDAARCSQSIAQAAELARRARSLNRRSVDSLRFLAELLTQDDDVDREEFAQVLADLVDGLVESGANDEALQELDRLESLGIDVHAARNRKARVLARMGRTDDAVETLLGLAEHYKATREKERLEQVYEQILKFDYRRRDVARSLRLLRETALARRTRIAVIGLGIVGLGFLAWIPIERWLLDRKIDAIQHQVEQLLAEGRLVDAGKAVHLATVEIGEHERLEDMHSRVQSATAEVGRMKAAELQATQRKLLDAATEQLTAGDVDDALDTWFSLTQAGMDRDAVERLARPEFIALQVRLKTMVLDLPTKLPAAPSIRQTKAEQEATIAQLRRDFETPERELVAGLLAAGNDSRIESILARQYPAFEGTLRELAAIYDRSDALLAEYLDRRSSERVATELTPLYHEALGHEQNHEFRAALEAYDTLARNHPADDDLKAHFLERVERYAGILRFLDLIEQAARNGDFATAQAQLRTLKAQYPGIPFDALARLPVRVQTTPPGADVYVDGELIGQAPLNASYRPEGETEIRVELDGFHSEATTLSGDAVGMVRSLLARKPDWTWHSPGSIDRTFVVKDRIAYLTDREGVASAIDLDDRRVLWSHPTGDLSGLLSRPVLVGEDGVAFSSVDGMLRCLDRETGEPIWVIEDLPAESGAVSHGDLLVVATSDGRLLAVDVDDRSVRWTVPLPSPVQADLVSIPGGGVLAVTTRGTAHAVKVRNGEVSWEAEVGKGVVARPALGPDCVVIAADDGALTVLDPATGKLRWDARLALGLVLSPAIADSRLFIAEGRSIHVFDIRTGRRHSTYENDTEIRSALSVAGGILFAGDDAGRVHALGTTDLDPRFLLRATEPALAPVLRLPDGTLLAAFGDRSLRIYLPRD